MPNTRFFLGANSADGFFSLYDDFARPEDGAFLRAVKGGPGCGKSSFMKRLAERAQAQGLDTEVILCSGDPDSLDGLYIPALNAAYADGTAPHVIDPPYPGAGGAYLNLGAFYDEAALRPFLPQIMDLNRRYKLLYADAYELLRAAGPLGRVEASPTIMETIRRRADGAVARELKGGSGTGRVMRRFLSAVSCKGRVFLGETVSALCDRIVLLDNALGFAPLYLQEIVERAAARGYDLILCPDCLLPEKPEAVLIPEAGLAFVADAKGRELPGTPYRHVRLDALAQDTDRRGLRGANKLRETLVGEAMKTLAKAKALHDELEAVYNPHVDFEGLYALADEHAKILGIG